MEKPCLGHSGEVLEPNATILQIPYCRCLSWTFSKCCENALGLIPVFGLKSDRVREGEDSNVGIDVFLITSINIFPKILDQYIFENAE